LTKEQPMPIPSGNAGEPSSAGLDWEVIFHSIPHPTVIIDTQNRILAANSRFEIAIGRSLSEIKGRFCWELCHGEGSQQRPAGCPFGKMLTSHMTETAEMEVELLNGFYIVSCTPIFDANGKLDKIIHIATDITERKRTERALRQSEEKFSKAFVMNPDSININRLSDGVYLDINSGFTRITGYTREDVIGRSSLPGDLGIWVNNSDREKLVRDLKAHGIVDELEAPFRTKDGRIVFGIMSARILDINGERCILSITHDITDRKKAEQALIEERERLSVTLKSIGDGVITTDREGKVVLMNTVAEELTGWRQHEAKGRNLQEIFYIVNEATGERRLDPVARVLASGRSVEIANHTILVSRGGLRQVIADCGAPIKNEAGAILGVVLVFRDITEKQKMIESLQNAQKLESLAVLAGGIAHDFNNLLGAIFGYIELAHLSTTEPEVAESLQATLKTLNRARALTHQLLTFAKGGSPVKSVEPLFPYVKDAAEFALSGSKVKCRYRIDPDLWHCDYDKNQIGQVIDNIVINAVQAMQDGGEMVITASNVRLTDHEHGSLGKGNYVRIAIADSGNGIPNEILPRIFDPFFTTKKKGSGLGLATSYSIVTRHGGAITAESEPGMGSIFTVFLPAAFEPLTLGEKTAEKPMQGSGSILLMDDDESIRETATAMLEYLGYHCQSVADGRQALSEFEKAKVAAKPFKAIICDLTIPGGMNGKEVVGEIRKIDKTIPLIVSSGYSDDPILSDPNAYGFSASISKPFTCAELAAVLAKNL
jgi:PAS domain S-box-containing protein